MSEFATTTGLIVPSVSAEDMTEMDRIAIEETGPTLLQMMENAGRNLAELVMERTAGTELIRVAAGVGGNGGGGICAARHLANHGYTVDIAFPRPHDLRAAADWQRHVFAATGSSEIPWEEAFSEPTISRTVNRDGAMVIVDALLGYNAGGPAREPEATLIRSMNECARHAQVRIFSLDLPSGIDATTGAAPGAAAAADVVLTLALPKRGLKRVAAELPTTEIVLADIGIPHQAYRACGTERPFRGSYREPLRLSGTDSIYTTDNSAKTNAPKTP